MPASEPAKKQQPHYGKSPTIVRHDKRLKPLDKLIYIELECLSHKSGYCWAKNPYLAEIYDVSPEWISKCIARLKECGYVRTEGKGAERKIFITSIEVQFKEHSTKVQITPRTTVQPNTIKGNTINNTDLADNKFLIRKHLMGRTGTDYYQRYKEVLGAKGMSSGEAEDEILALWNYHKAKSPSLDDTKLGSLLMRKYQQCCQTDSCDTELHWLKKNLRS